MGVVGHRRAEPATFHVDPAHTTAEFAVSYLGFAKQHGRFERTRGSVVLDPSKSAGSVDFVIDVVSVDTGWDLRDTYLRGEQMFDVARYPEVRFRSTRLVFDDALLVAVDGEITMHGVTRPMRLDGQAHRLPGRSCTRTRRLRGVGRRPPFPERVRNGLRAIR